MVVKTPSLLDIQSDAPLAVKKRFQHHLAAGSVSARTAAIYADAVERLARYLGDQAMPSEITKITQQHLEAYMAATIEGASRGTAAHHYRSLQQFFRWAIEEEIIDDSPMRKMKAIKVDVVPPEVLTDEQTAKLLDACAGRDFESRRDRALIRLLIDTGCRRAEVLGLRWAPDDPDDNDVDLDQRTLRVRGKGGRWRFVHFGRKVALDLDRYLIAREQHAAHGDRALWLGRKGPLTASGLLQIVRRRGREAGIERTFVHLFRHTFADRYLKGGGSESNLMQLAGWRSRTMLERYGASAATQRAHAEHDRLSPGDRL